MAGHHIKNCPRNDDKDYDEAKRKGVPTIYVWKDAMVNPEHFKKSMYKTMKSISHGVGAQLYSQDDVTSLSLNPHLAQEMSHGIETGIAKIEPKPSE